MSWMCCLAAVAWAASAKVAPAAAVIGSAPPMLARQPMMGTPTSLVPASAVLAIHAPCLLLTQRVWSTDPWTKLLRAQVAAERVGAGTVVVHPPFRWQRDYVRQFVGGIQQMESETAVRFAVENMFPLRARGREVSPYGLDWDPTGEGFLDFTLDLSHTSVSQSDAMDMRRRPKLPLPFVTPWLSSLWLGLVTPVDTSVARPLVEGLTTATVVTDPSGAEPFGIEPESFDTALRRALAEEESG